MTIGILTFHWSTNYGAVLQTYSLQEYLKALGHDVKIINYVPVKKSLKNCFQYRNPKNIIKQLKELKKEQSFIPFRKKWLQLTKQYNTLEELQNDSPNLDVYICGSDQVWNPYFLAKGEKKITPSYFLPFGGSDVKRISYAVSMGVTEYPEELKKVILPLIKKFNYLGVRENTGKQILEDMDFKDVSLVPDPTILLTEERLTKLIPSSAKRNSDIFFYILQENQNTIKKTLQFSKDTLKLKVASNLSEPFMSIENWLLNLRNTQFVVTNSFHGVIFSILFKKPFVVVPIENRLKGMNDRIITLLSNFNLESRILDVYDEDKVKILFKTPIDWEKIEEIRDEMKDIAYKFLTTSLT